MIAPRPRRPRAYAHRTVLHAKSTSALANAKSAAARLRRTKRPPAWLLRYLDGIVERLEPVANEMAKHRDEVW